MPRVRQNSYKCRGVPKKTPFLEQTPQIEVGNRNPLPLDLSSIDLHNNQERQTRQIVPTAKVVEYNSLQQTQIPVQLPQLLHQAQLKEVSVRPLQRLTQDVQPRYFEDNMELHRVPHIDSGHETA